MSFIRVYPESRGRGDTRLNQEKITTDMNSNSFKPKINIQPRNAGRGNASVADRDDKNPTPFSAGNQSAQRVFLVNQDVQKEFPCGPLQEEDCESNPDVKIESKNVSELIRKFNNATENSHPRRKDSDPKIPAKKLRMDGPSVLQSRAEALAKSENKMDTDSSRREFHSAEVVRNMQCGVEQLPNEVNLQFKLHKRGNVDQQNGPMEVDTIRIENVRCNAAGLENPVGKEIAKSKPVVKPRTSKNDCGDSALNQPAALEEAEREPKKEIHQNNISYSREFTKTVSVVSSASVKKTTIYVNRAPTGDVSQSKSVIDKYLNQSDSASMSVRNSHIVGNAARNNVDVNGNVTYAGRDNNHQSASTDKVMVLEKSTVMQKIPEHPLETEHLSNLVPSNCTDDKGKGDGNTRSLNSESEIKKVESLQSQSTEKKVSVKGPKNSSQREAYFRSDPYREQQSSQMIIIDSRSPGSVRRMQESPANHVRHDKTKENKQDTDSCNVGSAKTEYNEASNRINNALNTLKSELIALREQDLALLKQLINISETIQLMRRSRVLRVCKSLSFSSVHLTQKKPLQRRYRPVERQNSAPHAVERKRMQLNNLRNSTESELGGSLSSFEDSEFDSQSELEESTSSLNNIHSPKSPKQRPAFPSRPPEITLSLDVAEDTDQTYEDILKRNVKLWKMSMQNQESVIEEVACLL